jgi:hypothetical protein
MTDMQKWRSIDVGRLNVRLGTSSSHDFPRELHGKSESGEAVASTPFMRLVVTFPRVWEDLSPEEQDARFHERW